MIDPNNRPIGYKWRSSKVLVVSCVAIAIFSENFLYSFIVPILPVMLEGRLKTDPSQTQRLTYNLLSVHALTSVIAAPIVGHVADKVSSRKMSLIASLAAEVVGTVVVATCFSLPLLFLGRIIQAIGGIAVWIIGSATVTDTVKGENLATTLSMISVVFAAGMTLGPMVSGTLMHLFGYWVTWGTVVVVLVVNICMRFVMIDRPRVEDVPGKDKTPESEGNGESRQGDGGDVTIDMPVPAAEDETTALLQDDSTTTYDSVRNNNNNPTSQDPEPAEPEGKYPSSYFYRVMFRQARVLTGLVTHMANSTILVSFDTTLPLHVKRVFGWNTLNAGLMFGLLQLPLMILGPVAGRLKDKVGVCYPAGFGFLMMAPLLWLLGSPGEGGLNWIGSGETGKIVYMGTIVCIGLARSLVAGSASIELTHVAKEFQKREPGIFGPNGGLSRVYSLTNTAWNVGLLVGPPFSGFLTEHVGYYYMNICLAVVAVFSGSLALTYFRKK